MELRRQRSSMAVDGPGVPVKGLELVSPDARTAEGRCCVLPASSCTLASDSFSCSGGRHMRSFKRLDDSASSIKFTPQTAAIQSGVVAAAARHTPTAVGCVDAGLECAGACPSRFTGALVGTSAFIYGRPADYESFTSARSLLRFPASEEGKREFISSLKPCGLEHPVDTTNSMLARQPPRFRSCRLRRRMRTFLWLSAAAAVLHMLGFCSMTEVSCAASKNDGAQSPPLRKPKRSKGFSALGSKIAKALTKGVAAAGAGASDSTTSGESSGEEPSDSEGDGEGMEPGEEQGEESGISSALLEVPGPSGGMGPSASGGCGREGYDSAVKGRQQRQKRERSPVGSLSVVLRDFRRRGSSESTEGASGHSGGAGSSGPATRSRVPSRSDSPLREASTLSSKARSFLQSLARRRSYVLPPAPPAPVGTKRGILKSADAPKPPAKKRVRFAEDAAVFLEKGGGGASGHDGGASSSTPSPLRQEKPDEQRSGAAARPGQFRGRLHGTSGEQSGEPAARVVALAPPVPAHPGHRPSLPQLRSRDEEGATPAGRVVSAGPPVPAGSGPRYAFPQMQAARREYMSRAGSRTGCSARRPLRRRSHVGVPEEGTPEKASRKEK